MHDRNRPLPDHLCSVCGLACGFGQARASGGYDWYCREHVPAGFLLNMRSSAVEAPVAAIKPLKVPAQDVKTGDLFG